jgi:hypothetical protein
MPYFHVTFDRHVSSILRHGLGAVLSERNWPEADVGVYLTDDPIWGIAVMVDLLMGKFDEADCSPKAFVESLRIIVVDDSRIRQEKMIEDPSFPDKDCMRLYRGIIDVSGMPVLNIDDVMAEPGNEEALGGPRALRL